MKELFEKLISTQQISQTQAGHLSDYWTVLARWNETHNLTAIRDEETAGIKHFADSLALMPFQNPAKRLLDVGSGAGFPGLVLAIMLPHKKITLVEKSAKKCAFLTQVKNFLALKNITIACASVEHYQAGLFDEITARAFSTPEKLIRLSHHLLTPAGQFLLMMGKYPAQMEACLPVGWAVSKKTLLSIPELVGARCVVIVSRASSNLVDAKGC